MWVNLTICPMKDLSYRLKIRLSLCNIFISNRRFLNKLPVDFPFLESFWFFFFSYLLCRFLLFILRKKNQRIFIHQRAVLIFQFKAFFFLSFETPLYTFLLFYMIYIYYIIQTITKKSILWYTYYTLFQNYQHSFEKLIQKGVFFFWAWLAFILKLHELFSWRRTSILWK